MRPAEIKLIVHMPKTLETQTELAQKIAKAHAEAVVRYIKEQPLPLSQQQQLLTSIREEARKRKAAL